MFEELRAAVLDTRRLNLELGVSEDDHTSSHSAVTFGQATPYQDNAVVAAVPTNPRILPKVVALMGTNIYAYHMHLNVTPSPPPGVTAPDGGLTALGFHQDSGLQADCEYRPAPRFSLKVGYYLSDVSTPLRGNTWIVPGSHLSTEPLAVQDDGLPKGAMPVCCPSNSALIFDRRLYHTGSPNFAAEPRVAGFVGYAYRWLRPKEPMYVERAMEQATCPLLRQ